MRKLKLSPRLLCGVETRPPATENQLICNSLKPLYLLVLVNLFLLLGLRALFCEKLSTIANNLVNGAPRNVSTYLRSIRPGSLEHLSYKIRIKNQHQNLLVVIHAKIKRFLVPLSNSAIQRHLAKRASWACIYWEREREIERLKKPLQFLDKLQVSCRQIKKGSHKSEHTLNAS